MIPQSHDRKLTLETGEFSRSVKRAAIVARDNANRVVLETQGAQLVLSAESGTVGNMREEIEVAREGDDITIAFNARYLNDVLNIVETEGVVLELTEPLRPGILAPDRRRQRRLPLRADAYAGHLTRTDCVVQQFVEF